MRPRPACFCFVATLILGAPAGAQVELPAVFGEHMVLQRERPIPIWGRASPRQELRVSLGSQTARTRTDSAGSWSVRLEAMQAGGPFELRVHGSSELRIGDVLIGDVWICSGQSNMDWSVKRSMNPEQEVSAARFDRIRLFKVARTVAEKPQEDCKGSWRRCSPASIPDFSAVAYFFGRHLHRELGVPIGLIQSAWGGTPAEAWTSTEALAGTPELAPILERWRKILAGYPEARRRHEQRLAAWKKAPRAKRGRRPRPPRGPRHQHRPSGLYQGMIHPLTRLRTRGVIWYQGEANASRAYQYRTLFPLMIRDWRRAFGQDRLPFLFVQLANFKLRRGDGRSWAELREAQLMTLAFPDTAMAVTIDIGNPADIHPKNKQEVGRRLALAALARVHGRELVFSGPIYRSHRQSGNTIVLEFDHVHGGLATRGSPVLEGFEIAGADRKFHPAKARIRGDRVLVRSDKVGKPVAVRYAWADNPVCNLVNEAELPASPFRTDDWPGVTREAR